MFVVACLMLTGIAVCSAIAPEKHTVEEDDPGQVSRGTLAANIASILLK